MFKQVEIWYNYSMKTILKKCKILLGISFLVLFIGVDTVSADTDLRFYDDSDYSTTYTIEIDNDILAAKGYSAESLEEQLNTKDYMSATTYDYGNETEITVEDYYMNLFDSLDDSYYDINSWNDSVTISINKDSLQNYILSIFDMFTLDELKNADGQLLLTITLPGEITDSNYNVDNVYSYSVSYDLLTLEGQYVEVEGSIEPYNAGYDGYIDDTSNDDSFEGIIDTLLESETFTIFIILFVIIAITLIIAVAQVRSMKRRGPNKNRNNNYRSRNTRDEYKPKSMERQTMDRQSRNSRVEKKSIFTQITSAINEIKEQASEQLNLNSGLGGNKTKTGSIPYTTLDEKKTTTKSYNDNRYRKPVTPKDIILEKTPKKEQTTFTYTSNKPEVNVEVDKGSAVYEETTVSTSDTTAYSTQPSTTSLFKIYSNIAEEAEPAEAAEEAVAAEPAKAVDEE